jgi:hypothetical protein
MPKSASLAVPLLEIMTLPGLTSRCTIPATWAASSALATWAPISATRSTGSGPPSRTRSARVGALTSSITMKVTPWSWTTS